MASYKEPTPKDWCEEIERGLAYREDYAHERKWSKVEELFHLRDRTSTYVGPNLVYSTGDLLMSTLGVTNPRAVAKPRRYIDIDSAPILQSVHNQLIDDMRLQDQVDQAMLYAYLWTNGFLKIGYDSEFGFAPELDFEGGQAGFTLSRLGKFGQDKFFPIEFSSNRPGMPWVGAVPPHDIVVPWGTRSLNNCPWIAHRVIRHIDYIRADSKYDRKATSKLEPCLSMKDYINSYRSVLRPYRIGTSLEGSNGENDCEYVELWEIHDLRFKKIFVVALGHDEYLRNQVDFLQDNGLPFVEMSFVPRTVNIWRPSDAMYLLYYQAELNDIANQSTKQRRVQTLKYMARKGLITPAERNKMLSSDVGAVVEVENTGEPLSEVLQAIPASNHNMVLAQESEQVRGNARETVGLDRNSFGEYQGARTTAREVESVQEAKNTRLSRRQNVVRKTYIEILEKITPIIKKFWRTQKVIEILGQEGLMQWVSYTGDTFSGQYTIDVNVEDGRLPTSEGLQNEAIQLFQALAQDPAVDPIQLRKLFVNRYGSPEIGQLFSRIGLGPNQAGAPAVGQAGQNRRPGSGQAQAGAGRRS